MRIDDLRESSVLIVALFLAGCLDPRMVMALIRVGMSLVIVLLMTLFIFLTSKDTWKRQ